MLLNHLASIVEKVLNQALQLDPAIIPLLQKLSGKVIAIELTGLGWQFSFLPDKQTIVVLAGYSGDSHAYVTGAPFSLLRLLLDDDSHLANSPDVKIEGEIHTVQQFSKLFKTLDIDWEEQLSHYLGDIPAHSLGNLARQSQTYVKTGTHTFQQNLQEYLQEELRYLPTANEINHFLDDIDLLRNDIARLEARVKRLQQNA